MPRSVRSACRWDAKLAAAAAGLLLASSVTAAAAGLEAEAFDCVIEPHVVVKLATPVQGILGTVNVDRGDFVAAGDVVAELESGVEKVAVQVAEVRARNDTTVQSSAARLEFQQRKLDRSARLLRQNVVSESALDETRTETQVAELENQEAILDQRLAALELDRARETLARRTIRSPVDGVVVERLLSAGEYVHEQSPVMTIAQIDPLNVEVFVPIRWYGQIVAGMTAEVQPEEPVGGRHAATVAIVDQVFDAASGTFGVRLDLPNRTREMPAGLRCLVRFPAPAPAAAGGAAAK